MSTAVESMVKLRVIMNIFDRLCRNGLSVEQSKIENICRKFNIIELSIFGSAIRKDFRPESDIDLLVTYKPKSKITLFDEADLSNEFSELFNREIDIVDIRGLRNPIRKEQILANREIIYVNS